MEVIQVKDILNQAVPESLGQVDVTTDGLNLTGLVDMGRAVINDDKALDNFVRKLPDVIGRVIFVARRYAGRAPSVLMDGWRWGTIMEKISATKLPETTVNESWELEDGASYDQNIFTAPKVEVKFFSKRLTFEIPISITKKQVESAFQSAEQMNGFLSMIEQTIENAMTVNLDELIMSTINNFIAETIYDAYKGGNASEASHIRAINLLKLYKDINQDSTLTADNAMYDTDFQKFAAFSMANIIDQMKVMSTKYNIGGAPRFTSQNDLHVVMLSEFFNAANYYLQSNTFHDKYTALPNADTIAFWQGSGDGTADDYKSHSTINIVTSDGQTVNQSGIIAFFFDRDALGVAQFERYTTAHANDRAEFWNEWHKAKAGYFNDLNENGVVFLVA